MALKMMAMITMRIIINMSGLNFDGKDLFFVADTHFGHKNIIRYCHRPFESVEEMDETLIRNWNATVPPDAIVFHLGDFCLDSKERWKELFDRLNGREKYLIIGNHDTKRIEDGFDPGFTAIAKEMTIIVNGQPIILNHQPLSQLDTGMWQLFGHVHSGPLNTDNKALPILKGLQPTQYDVGVDNTDFCPVSFEKIRQNILISA